MRLLSMYKNSNFNVLMAVFLDLISIHRQFIGHIFSLSFRNFYYLLWGLETGKIMLTFIELLLGLWLLWV